MSHVRRERLAPRYQVPTTPIRWMVPRAKGRSSKLFLAEAAVIELSVVGAAIVAPNVWGPVPGVRIKASWNGIDGSVIIRRAVAYPGSTSLVLYGVEYGEPASALGLALYEHLVKDDVPAVDPLAPYNAPPPSSLPTMDPGADLGPPLSFTPYPAT